MKYLLLLVLLFFSPVVTHAQESDSVNLEWLDSLDDEQEIPADEQSEESSYTYSESEETPHTLVAPDQLKSTRQYQSEEMEVREFDDEKWKAVVGDNDFIEDPEKKTKKRRTSLPSIPWAGLVLKIISYIVIVGVVVYILYYILKNTSLDKKVKSTRLQVSDVDKHVENIEEIDIEGLLAQARAEGNFKLAIRLYYLSILKKLNETGVITWKKDKTNRDYLSELFSRDYYFDEVRKLTLSYEEVWYGEHVLTPDSFQRLTTHFETVYHKINTPQTP
jgi:hypothetical protein